jgi:hypothetical protein
MIASSIIMAVGTGLVSTFTVNSPAKMWIPFQVGFFFLSIPSRKDES